MHVYVVAVAATMCLWRCPWRVRGALENGPRGGVPAAAVEGPDPCTRAPPRLPPDQVLQPKIIHVQWKDAQLPALQASHVAKWRQLFPAPEYELRLWTDADMLALVQSNYTWYLPSYLNFSDNFMRVDAARLFILHRHGGFYADLDYEPEVNFWNRLPSRSAAVVESAWRGYETHQNSMMSSPPGHDFFIQAMKVTMERTASKSVLFAAGPLALDEGVVRYNANARASGSDQVSVLPCHNVNRLAPRFVLQYSMWWDRGRMRSSAFTPRELYFYWKDCGDPEDTRCRFSTHKSTSVWVKADTFVSTPEITD